MVNTAIWVYSPGNLSGIKLMTDTAEAGGIGILDFKDTAPNNWGYIRQNLSALDKFYPKETPLGFKVATKHFEALRSFDEFPFSENTFFIFSRVSNFEDLLIIKMHPEFHFYCEVCSLNEATKLSQYCKENEIELSGVIAVSAEAGGFTGTQSTFLLLQQFKEFSALPVFIRGGIGIQTARLQKLTQFAGVIIEDLALLFSSSPLSNSTKNLLSKLEGREFEVVQNSANSQINFLKQPWAKASSTMLSTVHAELKLDTKCSPEIIADAKRIFYWGDPTTSIWPIGQMIGLASEYSKKYRTLHRFIQDMLRSIDEAYEESGLSKVLNENSPLADDHGTKFPIVQGPMTRVSDTPEFASEVYDAGGLPFIALALLKGENLSNLLSDTASLMKEKSWGVGILGFVPPELREEQIKEIIKRKPPFAIIAGGRPDQANELEAQGIKTYLHVPVPSLLKTFINQGSTRFIFEGRECGGHVGPFNSFPLWEQMISTLIESIPEGSGEKFSVLFAGGIHNDYSAAMIAVLSAELTKIGVKVGILMGTAYLSCKETVTSGSITPSFQNTILASTETTLLYSGPGHANRCVTSPFSHEFNLKRKELLNRNAPQDEITENLDGMLLGRLKIASKGLKRNETGVYSEISGDEVHNEGMFMAGEAATLLEKEQSIAELHSDVCENASKLIQSTQTQKIVQKEQKLDPTDIAIVGVSMIVPGAQKTEQFWDTIISKKNQMSEIPKDRWDWNLLYDEDPAAEDKISSKWGGFIEDVQFDPMKYGIPPKSVPNITTCQLLALESVSWALDDAKMDPDTMDNENTSVIFATSDSGGFLANSLMVRSTIPFFTGNDPSDLRTRIQSWTEETFPGILGNVVPGRIANRMNFGGRNYAVDAACASSLLALDLGVRELTSGRSNIAIVGAIDVGQTPFGYMAFSKTGALSPNGQSLPFDKKANGIVISEGGVVTILKRLADAKKDGDKIYAVVKGIAGSSDGKGMGLTAPRSEGQQLSLHRAYAEAGFSPNTIDLYEGHGTGTSVGDASELTTIYNTLTEYGAAPQSVTLGSIKSLIGHTKMAAGLVSLAKTALALHYKVLPPHANITSPLDNALLAESPVFFHKDPVPWLTPKDNPRRAGVSAFGFGGANFHAVLEESTSYESSLINGGSKWPSEILVFSSDTRESLVGELKDFSRQFDQPLTVKLQDIAWSLAHKNASSESNCRLSIVVCELDEITTQVSKAIQFLESNQKSPISSKIAYSESRNPNQKVAFLFSGQGSQYLHMGREMSMYFKEFRDCLELGNSILEGNYEKRFSDYLYPPQAFDDTTESEQQSNLSDTHVAQPSIGLVSTGFLDVLKRLGVEADYYAGHSYGEFTALHASGVLSREDFIRFSEFRGSVMASAGNNTGTMAAVLTSRATIQEFIQSSGLDLVVANHNAPEQVVISGSIEAIKKAIKELGTSGIKCLELPVSAAFHSPMMEGARKPLNELIDSIEIKASTTPVYSNANGKSFPSEPSAIRSIMREHLLKPVEFVTQINEMYRDGASIFVELGPSSILTSLVGKILSDKDHLAIAAESSRSGVSDFLSLLGKLWTKGISIDFDALFANREVETIKLSKIAENYSTPQPKLTSWMINGQTAKPINPAFEAFLPQPILTSNSTKKSKVIMDNKNQQPQQDSPQQSEKVTHPQKSSNVAQEQTQVPVNYDATMTAYFAYQETMRQFLKTQEQIMRLFLGADGLPGIDMSEQFGTNQLPPMGAQVPQMPQPQAAPAPAYVQQSPAPAPVAVPSPQETPSHAEPQPKPVAQASASNGVASLTSFEAIKKALVGLISDKTGYPEDMITEDLDLEADLGVDSIKRVEIFQKFAQLLPHNKSAVLSANADRFVRIKQFKLLVETLVSELKDEKATSTEQKQNVV